MLELLNETVQLLDCYFRPLLLAFASVFAIYFSCHKVGNKVTARYAVSMDMFSEEYISKIVLANKKDKPVSIWSIHAVIDKNLQLELDNFNPPLVLKPFETVGVSLPKYSDLHLGCDKFTPGYIGRDVRLHIDVGDKLVELGSETRRDSLAHFSKITKSIRQFNGHVYNSDVAYFLCYYYDEAPRTAFIDRSGIIGNEWSFGSNHIGKKDASPEEIEKFLIDTGLSEIFTNYFCVRAGAKEYKIVFRKSASANA